MSTGARLLIVDDEAYNLHLLRRIFPRHYEIVEASSGQEALDRLQEQLFDIVLLDIMMPLMTGLEVLREIRQTASLAELPVILISALVDDDDVVRGIALGANDYITKPINIDIVQVRVQTQLLLKRYHDERCQLMEYLQSANELKSRLMHVAAHDLKNPLSNMSLMLGLQRSTPDIEGMQELITIGEDSVKAMRRIIEDFLDMNLFNDDKVRLTLGPVVLEEALKQVINQYAATARHKAIDLCLLEVPGVVIADERRLMQALSNLVSNAIKYSPPGRAVMFASEYRDGCWRIQVIDQGPGIPVEEQATLFEAFRRGSNKPTGGETSTGLGLWIVREMIRLQHGNVGVYCPAQGGSCFWIELPAAESAGTETETQTAEPLFA